METYDAVILAGGDYPRSPQALRVLAEAPFVCCCDSAAGEALRHGIMPDVVVGDGDSITEDCKEALAGRYIRIAEQEDNDLTKATRHLLSLGFRRIAYLGITGKREDHTIGNIFLLPRYKQEFGMEPVAFTDYGVFRVACGNGTFSSFARQQVSIFNLSCHRLSSEGLRWPLYPTTQLWQGTLNEALDEEFTINSDGLYIIYQTYEQKNI